MRTSLSFPVTFIFSVLLFFKVLILSRSCVNIVFSKSVFLHLLRAVEQESEVIRKVTRSFNCSKMSVGYHYVFSSVFCSLVHDPVYDKQE